MTSLFSTPDLWLILYAALIVLVGMCIGLCAHEQYAIRKDARTRAAKAAAQKRADVAGRKANAESVVWR